MPSPAPAAPPADAPLQDALRRDPPRATGFIVTIYGDVAEPRGGQLWMGTLIEACAAHGISESLVRTAVSRLVGAGRLAGERIGRRSYYRLTEAAQAEFAAAGRLFYAPPPAATGWLLALGAAAHDLPEGWARLGPEAALAPDRADLSRPPGALLAAGPPAQAAGLPELAARLWPLAEVAAAYRRFLDQHRPVAAALEAGARPGGAEALALRLRLVHRYRQAALIDPRLPAAALPADWPAPAARRLFVTAYLKLAGAADAHVGQGFASAEGLLPARTGETGARLERLSREAAG
jgi:phenylacetic acid degradation operon negative regulatory protein